VNERAQRMVEEQIRRRGVSDARVLAAMRAVPRHRFLPPELDESAYDDGPLSIGSGQTISQPYVVAYMAQLLDVAPDHVVLDVGTGSGYHAAVLAQLAREVYSIEIVPELAARAAETLRALEYHNVHVRHGDGYDGWPEHAPFDRVLAAAAPSDVPPPLVEQLAAGGKMVLPVGAQGAPQWITVVEKSAGGSTVERRTLPVQFVPFTRLPR
jgi:protein-L-isoaspartate(D-aspartate) O-methyltransferase